MKAAQIKEYGQADKIQIIEVEKPAVNDGQVLIEVHAASLNPFDTLVREGAVKDAIKSLPITLGGDIAGIVTDCGESVHDFAVGDKVYGQANVVAGNSGAFAEYTVTAANQIAKIPSNVSLVEAATLPLVGASALQALNEHIKLQPRQKILIHGGSGGIGTVAIQIAKHIGAHVATTATGEGLNYVKELGADVVIDYTTQKFEDIIQDYDAVFDTVGGETYRCSFKVLKRGGVIVSMAAPTDEALSQKYGVTSLHQSTRVTTEVLNNLTKLIEKGAVKPHVGKVFQFEQIREAFEAREDGKIVGKVVLEIKQ